MEIKCCFKCEDRGIKEIEGKLVRCHSICEKYISERAEFDAQSEGMREQRKKEFLTTAKKMDNLSKKANKIKK